MNLLRSKRVGGSYMVVYMENMEIKNIIEQIFNKNHIKNYGIIAEPLSIVDKKTQITMQGRSMMKFLVHELPQEFCIKKVDMKVIYYVAEQNHYPINFCSIQSTEDFNFINDSFSSVSDKPKYRIVLLDKEKNKLRKLNSKEYLSLYEAVSHIPNEYILIDYDDTVCKILKEKSKTMLGR